MLVELRGRAVDSDRGHGLPSGWDGAMKAAVLGDERRETVRHAQNGLDVGRLLAGSGQITHLPFPMSAWTGSRDIAAPPTQTFRQWFAEDPQRHNGFGMSTRETMLAAIRAAVSLGAGPADAAPIPRDYAHNGVLTDHDQVIDLLVDRLLDYKALVTRTDRAGLPAALDEALAPVRSLVVPAGLAPDLHDALRGGDRLVVVDGEPDVLTADQLDRLDAVVTAARVAIALTGTIMLDAGPDQGRRALSLVPDRHLIILTADQIVETVPEGFARLTPTAPLTMISGPSATSDIELSRVEGVHGPRTLHVLIVTD